MKLWGRSLVFWTQGNDVRELQHGDWVNAINPNNQHRLGIHAVGRLHRPNLPSRRSAHRTCKDARF